MKIVKRGTPRPKYPWVGRYLCAHCNSVIDLEESDKDDVKGWDDDQRDGMLVKVRCPVCDDFSGLLQFDKTTTYVDDRKKWDAIP